LNRKDFNKLLASIKEAGRIRRGEITPAREWVVKPIDPKAIRRGLGLTQTQFADMIGVSVSSLRNWEQGRRRPVGPARALLIVAQANPRVVHDALKRQGITRIR